MARLGNDLEGRDHHLAAADAVGLLRIGFEKILAL